ncbi:hypothetical protein GAO09_29005 [Rhizobiales bacterium RZME27]|uniref:Uncharacterized protein n=1 Tax=Endobacterium cereale TaxID=2663029 RepID=A0A6A8AGW1_9HYPH|nr:hypothetical protein [Endobacterium cereale]MQY50074.1 hypothetical protein [Endobacterium cereale]
MTTLYAYEVSPITNPDRLYFAATLDECRSAAQQQRSELRDDPEYGEVEPMPIYRVNMEIPDLQTLLDGLNNGDDLTNAIIIDRTLVETVSD